MRENEEIGLGCIGRKKEGRTLFVGQMHRTTTLEFAGFLVHFMMIQEELKNQHIHSSTGGHHWSSFLAGKRLQLRFENFNVSQNTGHGSCNAFRVIHVVHLQRRSTWEAETADNLSRKKTTIAKEEEF